MNSSQAMIKESQLKILRTQFMAENSPFLDSAGNSEFSGSSAGVSSFFFPKLIPPPQDLYQYHAQSFHEEQLFDKRRKTQSHSPNSRRILYKLYQVQNSEEITSPWSSSQNSNLDSSTQQIQVERVEMPNIRQKSTGSISLEIIENFHKFQQHLIFQKYLSDAELLEIKHNFIEPEKFKSSQVNYFTIILGNVIQLLDSFIGMTRDQLLGLQKCKEIIIRFDKLRGDMMNKLKSTEKSQTFSSLNIQFLNIIFGSIRYILTRFGRIINFYDTLQSYYKRKLFTMMSNKQAPAIRKIQQQESMLFSDNDQSKRSPASTNSSNFQSNSLNNSDINNLKGSSQSLSQIMQSPNLLSTSMTTYDQLTPGANNKAGQETAKEVFFDLTEKEKSICIEKYMKVITQRWRQEHEDERKMTVPLIVCRICSQKFYADMEKDHSKYCKEKVKKINEQPQLNQKFLELSNKLTECMLHIEKTNMLQEPFINPSFSNTPRLTYSNKNMIHSTPTLARRNLGLSSLYSQDSGNNSDIELNSKSKEDQFKIDESQRKSSFYREERKQIVPMHRPIEEELKCDGASSSSSDGGLHVVETFNVPQRREGPKVAIPSLDLSKAQTASQHDKPMDPLTKLSLSKMESATQPAKPQNPLLMYTGRSTQAANEPTSQGNTQRTLGQIGQQLPSQVKNVSSTLNTLRVLEASKNIMSFEKPKTVQTQLSNVSVGEQQAKDIKNELLKSEDKPQEPEQSKEELSARPTFKQEESKIQQIAPSNSFIKSLFPIGNLPQVKPIPSKVEPSKNILGTFATIRQDLKKETQPPPLSARPAATSAMGFFNQQKTEEKKKFEENEAKLKQEEESKVIKIDLSKVALPTPKITSIQLPKSPYLQNVSRKFDNAKPLSQYFQNLTVQNDHVETPKSQMDLTGKSGAHMPTSPYISISKNMTKEQRKQQIDKLKKHVQIQLHKGTINDKQGKNRDKIPISNAFSLNIKNEREEAIKNMEHLRLSVKLKKRANPLEKLVNKLMHHENQEANQSLITTNILDVANISIAPPSPMNFSTISEELKSLPKPQTSLQKSHILGSKLQSITEDQEDDPGQSQKIISPTKHQLAESPLKLDQVDKKLDDLGQINKKKTFTGMSPIITFRPLNKIGSDSLQNTPLGTPDLRGAITSRDQYSQSQNSSQNFDDQKTNQVLVGLKSAKKEMDILENLKSMAVDIFNLSIQQINRKHQIKIMEQYLHQLKSIQYQGLLGYKSSIIVGQFISMIEDKIKAITEIEIIDKKYVKTLPGTELNIRLEEEKMNNSKLSRKMNLSIQSREAPSSIKKSSAKKSSSFFFPPTFSPRRENMLQAYAYMQQQQHSDNNSSQSDSMKGQPLQTNYSPQSFTNQKIDTLHFGSLEMQLTCATPLIAPRGLNFMNDGNQFINPHMLKLPPSYMSISQMHSPPVVNKTQYNNSNIVNSDKKNLQSIQEERTLEIKAQVNAAQVRLQLNNTQAQRQKSQFSNPSRLNQDKRSGSINSRISKSSFNESNGSCSSDSDIIIDLKESITLDQGAKTCKSPYVLTPKATENVTDSPGSIRSKQSKTSLSTFSKVKKAAESAQKQKSQERSPKDKISDEFFNDDDNITVRRSRHQSFDLSVKRKMSDTSQSKSRLLKKYHQDTFLRKGSNDFIECQSDIVIGTNYDQEGGENEDEDRKTNSDIHDMFQVHEIFEDEVKFNRLLARLQIQECLQQERDHAYKVNSESQHLDLEEEDSDEEVLTMERVRFSSCVNLPSQLESCSLESSEKQSQQQQQQVVVELIFFRISIHDFILLKTLNKGAYGKVILARKKNTDDFFAIKVLDKQKMVEKNVIEFIMNEKNILSQVSNDFIVRGVYTFQSKKYLYMVMEFMKGGDFASLLEEVEAFDEETARYYIAQIVLALDYLHKHGVIHRDLKPDNILIDSDGHIKLTDFGLSDAGVLKLKETAKKHSNKEGFQSPQTQMRELEMQQDIQKLLGAEASVLKQATLLLDEKKKTAEYPNIEPIKEDGKQVSGGNAHKNSGGNAKKPRMLGTAQYMAPEIIKGEEHTYALDFWSLGVIVYEFLTGLLPFNDETPDKIFEKIKIKQMTYPPVGRDEGQMTPEAHNFIDRLLTLDPKQRLGSNGIDEVKNHPYFREIQWDKIMEMEPPFKPVGREQDTKYFTKAAYQEDDIMPIINDQKSFQAHEVKEFNKFDVINYDALQSYNQKEAVKALERAKRMRKRAPPQKPKKSLLNETILMDIKVGITSVEQLAEKADEESLVTPKTSCQELHKLV